MAIHIKVASAVTELEAVYRLRAMLSGLPGASDLEADEGTVDRYDSFSSTRNVLIADDELPVGALRVAEESEFGLPGNGLEHFTSIRPFLQGKVIGVDRMVLRRGYRARPGVLIGGMKVALQVARDRGGDHLLVIAPPELVSILEKMGFSAVGLATYNPAMRCPQVPLYGALTGIHSPFLEWEQQELIETFGPFFHRAIFSEGETIFREGESGQCAYAVARGSVQVVAKDAEGHEVLLGLLGPGELFGELSLLDSGPRASTVRASAPETDVAVISRACFQQMLAADPRRLEALFRLLAKRLREHSARVVALTPESSIPLLVRILTDAAHSRGLGGAGLLPGVTLEWLAGQLGRPPELVRELTEVLERRSLMTFTLEGLWLSDVDELKRTVHGTAGDSPETAPEAGSPRAWEAARDRHLQRGRVSSAEPHEPGTN